jgi:surfactin synthase thioesterase subunit
MMHGNAGQAADREYVLPCLSSRDSLYVLEYPGYGVRAGRPCLTSMNAAAAEAYHWLRSRYPKTPICAIGESIGSGAACALAAEQPPPDKIVLVVPFDTLADVAAQHFPFLPARWMLRDRWDNVEALQGYNGPVDIFGAADDQIIAVQHARELAKHVSQARFTVIPGGHNDWSEVGRVQICR